MQSKKKMFECMFSLLFRKTLTHEVKVCLSHIFLLEAYSELCLPREDLDNCYLQETTTSGCKYNPG